MDTSRIILFSGICFLIFYSSSGFVETIDVHQAKDLLEDSGYTYIDVRTTEEFNKGHVDVKNILNIPYMFSTPEGRVINPQFLEQVMSACNKEDELIVGCQSGVRSVHASVVLLEAEFKHIKNMGGGYAAWVENGLPVKTTKSEL